MTNQHNNPGYDTPGNDTIIKSTSPAVPSPSKTGQERLSPPDPAAVPRGETPGDANPALDETVGFEQGQTGTADLLRARETAEEEAVRARGDIHPYQDEGLGDAPDEFKRSDTGRPAWPNDRQEDPMEYMESARGDSSLMAGSPDKQGDLNLKGRADMTVERGSTEAAARETGAGLPPTGLTAADDEYERREMHKPTEPSDLDRIAPGMLNLPPEDENA